MEAGTKLGPYEILSRIGEGGMGVVYRARDTRLDRIVAVKVSAARFSERFEREARAIAALNDPHICTLYDVGPDYLVMEYVEGEPVGGPLPLERLLKVGADIAGALDTAHRKGIIHRDLKPANILLTKTGVKLLDFGLAKHSLAAQRGASEETVTRALTQEGSIVGTLQYMAPEQLQGKEADARSDIFSFGCVLYELAAGRRAFDAKDSASIIAAILKDDPPPMIAPAPGASSPLDRVVRKCLAKDPDDRWQTARDLRDELLWIASGGERAPAMGTSARQRGKRERIAWIAAAVFGVAAVIASIAALRPRAPAVPDRIVRFPLVLPADAIAQFSLSPDGESVLFGRGTPDKYQLWLRSLATGEDRPIPRTENAGTPFWYPDSRSLGVVAGNQVHKIDLASGLATVLSDKPLYNSMWTPAGLLASGAGVRLIPSDGGPPKQLTTIAPTDSFHIPVQVLDDSRRFLFFATRNGGIPGELNLGSVDASKPVALATMDSYPRYVAPGYLLYLRGDTLVAQPFDSARGSTTGPAQSLIDAVGRSGEYQAWMSVSQTGVLIFRHGHRYRPYSLTWFDRSGKPLENVLQSAEYSNPALSPDGNRVAVGIRDPQTNTRDVWVFDLTRGGSTRLTFDPADDFNPAWSPDGSRVAFTSTRKGARNIYVKNTSGSGEDELLLTSDEDKAVEDWSPDGSLLSFNRQRSNNSDILFLPMTGADRKPVEFRATPFGEQGSRFSPDGRWIAYRSEESGKYEVFVQSVAPNGGRWQISTAGGDEPMWRGDGQELFYVSNDNVMMAVDIRMNGTAISAGIPHRLFAVPAAPHRRNRYVVTRDGHRFLIVKPEKEEPLQPPTVVINWPLLLNRK